MPFENQIALTPTSHRFDQRASGARGETMAGSFASGSRTDLRRTRGRRAIEAKLPRRQDGTAKPQRELSIHFSAAPLVDSGNNQNEPAGCAMDLGTVR